MFELVPLSTHTAHRSSWATQCRTEGLEETKRKNCHYLEANEGGPADAKVPFQAVRAVK
jgi:hypothetical protein